MLFSKLFFALLGAATLLSAEPIQIGTRPESLARGFEGDLFVTVMGEQNPGDAVIKRIDSDGKITTFAGGFESPGKLWPLESEEAKAIPSHGLGL